MQGEDRCGYTPGQHWNLVCYTDTADCRTLLIPLTEVALYRNFTYFALRGSFCVVQVEQSFLYSNAIAVIESLSPTSA